MIHLKRFEFYLTNRGSSSRALRKRYKAAMGSDSLLSHISPLPQGEGWGEGIKMNKPIILNPPHPGLLPEGEGITLFASAVTFCLSLRRYEFVRVN